MREIRTLCDRCGRPGATQSAVTVDRRCDAAGSMEDVLLVADLCDPCRAFYFELLLEHIGVQDRYQNFLERFLRDCKTLRSGPGAAGSGDRVFQQS